MVPRVSNDIIKAMAVRQDLFRLTQMGWPDKTKQQYIKTEYDPDVHVMQLSMLADEIIADYQQAKREHDGNKKNNRGT